VARSEATSRGTNFEQTWHFSGRPREHLQKALDTSAMPWYHRFDMKENIHPKYYPNAKVQCACGNTFTVGSTKESLDVEVCAGCHPFYTGKGKLMDRVGQIQKFRKRLAQKDPASTRSANPPSKRPKQKTK